jgi:hypothetical protein
MKSTVGLTGLSLEKMSSRRQVPARERSVAWESTCD